MPTPQPRAATLRGPDPDTRRPRLVLPPGSCDCHAHVFGPQDRFPYLPHAAFIPPDALPGDYVRMLRTIGCERAVLVQPSIYGTDNAALLDALRSGIFPFRGVAVIDEHISDRDLEELHGAGVRGVRINLAASTPGLTLDQASRLAPRLRELGWHLQFFLDLKKVVDAEERLGSLPIDIVLDHFGWASAKDGVGAPPFQALLRLLRRDNFWSKISGVYIVSQQAPDFADVTALAQAVVATAPGRTVWATDWPHPMGEHRMPNDGDLVDMLAGWIPDAALLRKVLVDNPARLYDF